MSSIACLLACLLRNEGKPGSGGPVCSTTKTLRSIEHFMTDTQSHLPILLAYPQENHEHRRSLPLV